MDLSRALTYTFDDGEWVGKLVIIVVMSLLSSIPLLGLLATAVLLGYVVELVSNVRDGDVTPLPQWENYDQKLSSGGSVLIAQLVYNIPTILLSCCLFTMVGLIGEGGEFPAFVFFCTVPLILLYSIAIGPLLAVGIIRYAENQRLGEFFKVNQLISTITSNRDATLQWLLYAIIAYLILTLLSIIPCVGTIAMLAMIVPVQGYLLGEYARMLDSRKRKPKRAQG